MMVRRVINGNGRNRRNKDAADRKKSREKADRLRREMLKVNRAAPGLPANVEIRTNTNEP